jgi:hypothetical protein
MLGEKLTPVIVTEVPPWTGPYWGEIEEQVGVLPPS